MLSAPDAGIVRRDPHVHGLAVLLDTDALLEVLSHDFPELDATAAEIAYVRYKPGTSCLCSYRISGRAGTFDIYAKAFRNGRNEKLRHWRSDHESGAPAPARRASQQWQIGISVFPDDRRLRAIRRLTDPATRSRVLRAALPAHSDWYAAPLSTLRYKPERRYVASLARGGEPVAVLKLYDDAGYARARAHARAFRSAGCLRIARCVGESAKHRLLAFDWIDGTVLQEVLNRGEGLAAVEVTGSALAALHESGEPVFSRLKNSGAASAVRAAATSVSTVCPLLADRARELARHTASVLGQTSQGLCAIHGDFYAEQIITTPGHAAIVDFDRAAAGDPAEDLGTFAAHLRRAALEGVCSDDRAGAALDALLTGYGRTRQLPPAAQLRQYTAAALIRLAAEPFRRRVPAWTVLTEAILEEAARTLDPPARGVRHAIPVRARSSVVVNDGGLADDAGWSFLRPGFDPLLARRYLQPSLEILGVRQADLREIRVIRHKPGRRSLVEYVFDAEVSGRTAQPLALLGKSRVKGVDRNAHAVLESLWTAGFNPGRSSVCVPQPLGTVPELRMTVQLKVPGRPAGDRLAAEDGPSVAARIAEALYTLHTRGVVPVRRHSIRDEVRILRERLPQIGGGAGAARIDRLLRGSERLAGAVTEDRPRAIHRDFYPAQVLVDGDRLWLLDFDLYCAGDPALDVGNFIAHMIEERLRSGSFSEELTETESAFESTYVRLAGARLLPAIRAYTTLSLVRHVHLSTQYPERRHATPALVELCERRLSGEVEGKLYA